MLLGVLGSIVSGSKAICIQGVKCRKSHFTGRPYNYTIGVLPLLM